GGRRLRPLGLRAFGRPCAARLSSQERPTVPQAALGGARFGHLAFGPSQDVPANLNKVPQMLC
ncbi:MAG TPA: hypothetical protein PKB13_05665, partial [Clostridia bacterium]|nr:hypothetical protein [Clostridia bacterium]